MSVLLIKALQNPSLYPHPVKDFHVIETHLSWVILTGYFAYKIKKPLNLGFQDFSTLAKRQYYCELELVLNRRLAPQLYLCVLPITGSASHPILNGKDEPFEYAIQMQEFSQEKLLSTIAKNHALTQPIILALAQQVAHFHQTSTVSEANTPYGLPNAVFSPIQDNFDVLKKFSLAYNQQTNISEIEDWAKQQFQRDFYFFHKRKTQGFIRACHGDLHLGNIALLNDKPVIFDCIEFNEHFRWTDVINDLAFLTMDLDHQTYSSLSNLLANQYFELTHDYEGARLLTFYQCYRAMVRAKITSFQISQTLDENKQNEFQNELNRYLSLAHQYIASPSPSLTITFGVSGSGKTFFTQQSLMKEKAIRLRSDVIRKHMYGLAPNQIPSLAQKQALYHKQTTQLLYTKLASFAKLLLEAGHSVIIDATCLKQTQRELFFNLSQTCQVPFKILSFDAPKATLIQRIRERIANQKDASDADETVLIKQLEEIEPLSEAESVYITPLK